ncbi:MAG: MFS transporter [Acidobacteria bacterium]|nr:MFS transporter [Acidobacteriota bacterium]
MSAMPQADRPVRMGFTPGQAAIAILLFFVAWLNYIDRQVLSVLAPVLQTEIGLTQTQYAWAVNAFLLAYAVMYAGSGLVLDRWGSRLGLAFFVGAWSLASALHAAVGGFLALAAFRFLLGLTEPGGWTGAIKTISERYAPVQRGLAAGIFSSGASVATLVAPPLVVYLTRHYGWRNAFLIPSLAGLLWIPLWLRATRRARPPAAFEAASRLDLRRSLALLRDKRVLAYVLARFFGDSSGYFFMFWIPQYLSSVKNFSFEMIGALGWIPFLANDVGPLTGGYLSGRLIQAGVPPLTARKILMTAASLIVAAGALSQSTTRPWAVLLALSVSTFGVGVWAGNLHALPADAFRDRNVATAYGLAGSAGAVGGILFNTLAGYFTAQSHYFVVFLVLLLLEPLGAAALWMWLRDPQPKED